MCRTIIIACGVELAHQQGVLQRRPAEGFEIGGGLRGLQQTFERVAEIMFRRRVPPRWYTGEGVAGVEVARVASHIHVLVWEYQQCQDAMSEEAGEFDAKEDEYEGCRRRLGCPSCTGFHRLHEPP